MYMYVYENLITIAGCVVGVKFVTRIAATVVTQSNIIAYLRASSIVHCTFIDICDKQTDAPLIDS